MEQSDPRTVLGNLVASRGESLTALSRMLRRNDAYLQQFVRRGTPRSLSERDRTLLATYFGIGEQLLGAPSATPSLPAVGVRLLDVAASAGSGRMVEQERVTATLSFDRATLDGLGIRSTSLALIQADGDSMAPMIEHGDRIMVDEADRRVSSGGGIYVIRLDGALMVKRISRVRERMTIISDNPAYPRLAVRAREVEVIGKVVWLSRALR